MNQKDLHKKFVDLKIEVPKFVRRIPGIVKVEGLRFIADNFDREGFEKSKGNYKKWPKRKGDKNHKKLIGEKRGGSLKRGWQATSNANRATFSNALPYAAVHNEGLMAGRPPHFQMKQSEMIGPSAALDERVQNKTDIIANKVF